MDSLHDGKGSLCLIERVGCRSRLEIVQRRLYSSHLLRLLFSEAFLCQQPFASCSSNGTILLSSEFPADKLWLSIVQPSSGNVRLNGKLDQTGDSYELSHCRACILIQKESTCIKVI